MRRQDGFPKFVAVCLVGMAAGLFAGSGIMNFAGYGVGFVSGLLVWGFVLLVYYKLIKVKLNIGFPFSH